MILSDIIFNKIIILSTYNILGKIIGEAYVVRVMAFLFALNNGTSPLQSYD